MTPTKMPERSKTMIVDRKSPLVLDARARSRNGAVDKVNKFRGMALILCLFVHLVSVCNP